MHCIYKITNLINGKTYIGQHKYKKNPYDSYMGSGKLVKRAQEKYGIENFKKDILVSGITSKSFIDLLEKEYIKFYRSIGKAEYNIADGGDGGAIHKSKHSEEAKRKISEAKKGKTLSEEHKQKLALAQKGKKNALGKKYSEETKQKMSASKKGEKNPLYGKHISAETRIKMSKSHKGKYWFNNGIKNVREKICPEGFVPGKLIK